MINNAIWSDNFDIPTEHIKLVLGREAESKKKPELMIKWEEAKKILLE